MRIVSKEPDSICLHTVKWLQVLLFNTNSFIWSQLNCFKNSRWLNNCIWHRNGTLAGTTTPGLSETGSYGNKAYSAISKAPGLGPHH